MLDRILHALDYITNSNFQIARKKLDVPEVGGVTYDEVVEAGEHLPGMAALWDVATPEERREMATILLEPEGFSYDTEWKMIAALKPRTASLPILRLLQGLFEYKETSELLVTVHWSQRNRRRRTIGRTWPWLLYRTT